MKVYKTAECVTPRHPDKMCDQISDGILDLALTKNPRARVAVEVCAGHGDMVVIGEIGGVSISSMEVEAIVQEVTGVKPDRLIVNLVQQSGEIAQGVDIGGAGDQGIMVGYACKGNSSMIPLEMHLARSLCRYIYEIARWDGKTQITLVDGKVETIVASFQNCTQEFLKWAVHQWLLHENVETSGDVKMYLNPAGNWRVGGFDADTGLTGRKLAVDNYGPNIPVGGGAFSGKDSTKVDRSGAYAARKLAVTMLQELDAEEVTVKLAYAIGVAEPVMASFTAVRKTSDGDEVIEGEIDTKVGATRFNLTPSGIIEDLRLREPQFRKLAEWGSFGNGAEWDRPY